VPIGLHVAELREPVAGVSQAIDTRGQLLVAVPVTIPGVEALITCCATRERPKDAASRMLKAM
jgi:hypothetical protein